MNNPQIIVKNAPFKHFCMSIGAIPTSYLDSLDYYETLLWLIKYLEETIIPTVNNNGEAVSELQRLFIELKNFVDNYFDNLDVQEEINNKLDEMVEDGTLEVIIGKYINDFVNLIFPKFWDNASSGDCNLIKYDNKNLMIDTYNTPAWSDVRTMLLDNDINSLDYLIITHYHGDHYGNLENLITYGYVNENTTVYLPADTTYLDGTNGTENVNARIEQVKTLLNSNNITYIIPNEYEELNIKNLKIVFYNCNANALKSYYFDNGIIDYNQYSTVNLIYHKNIKYLYMGDGGPNTYKRLIDTNFITGRIDLFKLGHHGHNTSTNVKFMNLIQPTYTIQLSGSNDFIKNNFSITSDIPVLKNNGSKIYPTNMQPDYLKFKCDGDHINCVNGYEYALSNNLETINLYVNKNANTSVIQDGTQTHPFTEIMQALGIIKTFPQYNYNIYISTGDYGLAHPTDNKKRRVYVRSGKSSLVRLIGTGETNESVILSGGIIIDNSSIILEKLTLDVDNVSTREAVHIFNSNVVFNDISIKSMTNTLKNINGINANWNSNIKINDLFINDINNAINITHCTFSSNILHFGNNISGNLFNPWNSNVITKTITIDNETQNNNYTNNYKLVKSPIELFSGDADGSDPITLSKNINLFDWVEITYKSDNNFYNATGKIYSPNNKNIGLGVFYVHSGGNVYNKQANCNISGTSLTLSHPTQIAISDNGVSKSTSTGLIHITKVVGGFNQY